MSEEEQALTFSASAEDAGQRLDAFLAARVPGVSRTTLKRLIDDGEVLVAGRPSKPSYKLRGGEEIEVETPEPPPADLTPEEIPLDILHEDEEVAVVNKPAGMVVHPAAGVHSGTLANALAYRFAVGDGEKGGRGDGATEAASSNVTPSPRPPRVGIVHRLDRDTSGLLVVAKTARAHESLSEQFRVREVYKSYVALVHGLVREERGRIEEPLARDRTNRTRMAVVRGGRAALTVWRARRLYARLSLLDVQIKTGRTHQIRVHLAWMKHPVVGDETYGAGRDRAVTEPRLRARIQQLGRQFLHAERLAFRHPTTGERLLFTAPLPTELQSFLDWLDAE